MNSRTSELEHAMARSPGDVSVPGERPVSQEPLTLAEMENLLQYMLSYTHDEQEQEIWESLAATGVSTSSVVESLRITMESSQKPPVVRLTAAAVFLNLFLLPNCPVYSVFNPLTFSTMVQALRQVITGISGSASVDAYTPKIDGGKKKNRGKGKGTNKHRKSPLRSDEDDETGDMMDEDGNQPGGDETRSRLGVTLLSVLGYLSQALEVLKLANQNETRKSLLGMLVEATRFSLEDQQRVEGGRKGYAGADRTRVSVGGGRTVEAWKLPYRMLLKLTDPQHGKPLETAAHILMAFGPHILMTHADVTATSSNSSKAPSLVPPSVLRSRALDFVTSDILTKAPKECIPAVESLMRHLCLNAPERAEGRAAAVEAVMKVYETVGRKEREGFFLFVGKLARVDRAAVRVVAVDLSAALVERMAHTWGRGEGEKGGMGSGVGEEGGAGGSCDGKGGDALIGRGAEEAAGGEAGAGAGGEGGDEEGDKGDEVSLSQGSASQGDSQSGRESGNGSREAGDSCGSGSVRAVIIDRVGGCLELIFRRASDVSPTVRARALVALTATLRILKGRPSLLDAVLAGHAHAHAPAQAEPGASVGGGSGLSGQTEPGVALGAGAGGSVLSVEEVLGMVRSRLEDEKGLVRKAAVGALEEIVGLSKLPLREELVDAIGELCSDSLLSVRRVALTALSKVRSP
ncbi:unnamed protein product [Closterium sp. Yama58-4]|nr:unnamed protein product [Closterium sp. Yama58-4]